MSELGCKRFAALLVTAMLLTCMAGCFDSNESDPSGVSGFNYTDYYIAQFNITNEGQDLSAGGANMFPKEAGEERSESGEMCCIAIPRHWRPGMKLVVKWRRDTHPYDEKNRSGDQWLTATTETPPYGPLTYGFWVHFLPGDRIRVQVQDSPPIPAKPDDHDPYIVQGVLDPELNKKETPQ